MMQTVTVIAPRELEERQVAKAADVKDTVNQWLYSVFFATRVPLVGDYLETTMRQEGDSLLMRYEIRELPYVLIVAFPSATIPSRAH